MKADLSRTKWVIRGNVPPLKFLEGFKWDPFPRIPNVRSFKINIASMDKVFDYFGIKKRMSPSMEYALYENRSTIRYA